MAAIFILKAPNAGPPPVRADHYFVPEGHPAPVGSSFSSPWSPDPERSRDPSSVVLSGSGAKAALGARPGFEGIRFDNSQGLTASAIGGGYHDLSDGVGFLFAADVPPGISSRLIFELSRSTTEYVRIYQEPDGRARVVIGEASGTQEYYGQATSTPGLPDVYGAYFYRNTSGLLSFQFFHPGGGTTTSGGDMPRSPVTWGVGTKSVALRANGVRTTFGEVALFSGVADTDRKVISDLRSELQVKYQGDRTGTVVLEGFSKAAGTPLNGQPPSPYTRPTAGLWIADSNAIHSGDGYLTTETTFRSYPVLNTGVTGDQVYHARFRYNSGKGYTSVFGFGGARRDTPYSSSLPPPIWFRASPSVPQFIMGYASGSQVVKPASLVDGGQYDLYATAIGDTVRAVLKNTTGSVLASFEATYPGLTKGEALYFNVVKGSCLDVSSVDVYPL